MTALLQSWARALGGAVSGASVLCPGPGHSFKDRSLSVTPGAAAPDGFIVASFAGDDWRTCRDHVRARLGMSPFEPSRRDRRPRTAIPDAAPDDADRKIEAARRIWAEAGPVAGTLGEKYLRGRRGLTLDENLSHAVRFHARCPWKEGGETLRVPAMIAAMRQIDGDEITAVQRTRLAPDGAKLGRRMLGKASGAAIKIDRDEDITIGLHVGEGLETCLSGRVFGFRPAWALGSAGAIENFPVLAGIDALTIFGEHDRTGRNERAVKACVARWQADGREVFSAWADSGDLNDVAAAP